VKAKSKLTLAIDLAPVLATPAEKGLPDFAKALARERDPAVVGLGSQLDATVQSTIARAFRRSFVAAAIFALLAAIPLALRPGTTSRLAALAPIAAAALGAVVLLGAELGDGARAYGARPKLLRPCQHRPAPPTGETQKIVLAGLDLLACRLHETREKLVADTAARGVGAAELAGRVEKLAKLLSKLPFISGIGG
jgi:hypothetical protein